MKSYPLVNRIKQKRRTTARIICFAMMLLALVFAFNGYGYIFLCLLGAGVLGLIILFLTGTLNNLLTDSEIIFDTEHVIISGEESKQFLYDEISDIKISLDGYDGQRWRRGRTIHICHGVDNYISFETKEGKHHYPFYMKDSQAKFNIVYLVDFLTTNKSMHINFWYRK